tara:strand:- start:277 stop:771 length:495 start_codon:yes stop_codon:yes gene_type:complete
MNEYSLNTKWILWFHSINDTQWNKKSYKNLFEINNLYDLKSVNDTITKLHLQNGMFFIMRDDIFPTWEDPDNRNGCCISFKIPGNVLYDEWNFIINRILTEDILKDKDFYEQINGISISPKKEFNICKLWLRDHNENYTDFIREYEPHFTKEKSLIKKHELSDS